MTLEDFFTVSEIKDGLTAPSRVEKLVTVMQKDRDSRVKNVRDATKRWAAVASTIAATKNKDCLAVFVELNGLEYIDGWIKDAQKFSNDSTDSIIGESIIALLQALENLGVDNQRPISSRIWLTVETLLGHENSRVQDKARRLFESWKKDSVGESVDVSLSSVKDVSHIPEVPKAENMTPTNPEEINSDRCKDSQIQIHEDRLCPHTILQCSESICRDADHMPSSNMQNSVLENLPVEGLVETTTTLQFKQDRVERQSHPTNVDELCIAKMQAALSTGTDLRAEEIETEPVLQQRNVASQLKTPTSQVIHQLLSGIEVVGRKNNCSKHHSDSHEKSYTHGNSEGLDASFYRTQDSTEAKDDNNSEGSVGLKNESRFSTPATGTKCFGTTNQKISEIELECEIVDDLEVITKVSQEVARQVVDYRQPSCSSSEKVSGETPDYSNGKQKPFAAVSLKEMAPKENHSAEAYSEQDRHVHNPGNSDKEQEKGVNETESSQVTEATQEPEVNTEKTICDFDLNQQVCSDGKDDAALPAALLQSEGSFEWQGSAAASAFRPASEQKGFLDIDLNVAEGGEYLLTSGKQIPVSSGFQSAESSLEVDPGKSERLKFDLNRMSDDVDAPRLDKQRSHRSPSPASSSSSKHHSFRDFDLNNGPPHIPIDSSDQVPYHERFSWNVNACGGRKLDGPVISIMGKKVDVGRKDFLSQVASSQLPSLHYTHSRIYGYNGLAAITPNMSHPSPMYRLVGSAPPYTVDSRGVPVMPKVISSVPTGYSRPPLVLNMAGGASGVNSSGHARPGFDPSSSGFVTGGGNKDPMSLRQFLVANSQTSSVSGVDVKRKEPDSRWEPYPFSHRHQQPPWR